MNASITHLSDKYKGKLQYKRLVNGYRRYDPARGMDYILDLAFRDTDSGLEVLKRFETTNYEQYDIYKRPTGLKLPNFWGR
jgi:Chondroitin N-acetylgalactosaminyltransferase